MRFIQHKENPTKINIYEKSNGTYKNCFYIKNN